MKARSADANWTAYGARIHQATGDALLEAAVPGDCSFTRARFQLCAAHPILVSVAGTICYASPQLRNGVWAKVNYADGTSHTFHGVREYAEAHSVRSAITFPVMPGGIGVSAGFFNSSGGRVEGSGFILTATNVDNQRDLVEGPLDDVVYGLSTFSLSGVAQRERLHLFARLASGVPHFLPARHQFESAMLKVSNDKHAFIAADSEVDSAWSGSGRVSWALFNDIGYLYLPGFASARSSDVVSFARDVYAAVGRLLSSKPHCLVLDLRDNVGGNMWPFLSGLRRILPRSFGSFDRPSPSERDWSEMLSKWEDRFGLKANVAHGPGFQGKVVILTSEHTASSGEAIAIAIKANDRVEVVGEQTKGLTTGTLSVPLADGRKLLVSGSNMLDANGVAHPHGIVPTKCFRWRSRGALDRKKLAAALGSIDLDYDCSARRP